MSRVDILSLLKKGATTCEIVTLIGCRRARVRHLRAYLQRHKDRRAVKREKK